MAWESKYPNYPDLTCEQALKGMEGAIERVGAGTGTELDHEIYWAALLYQFCKQVWAGDIEQWILSALAEEIHFVLAGAPWEERFPMPGREPPEDWDYRSPKERRDRKMFMDVARLIQDGRKVTDAIGAVAVQWCLSFESVRAAYYAEKQKLKDALPEGFLSKKEG